MGAACSDNEIPPPSSTLYLFGCEGNALALRVLLAVLDPLRRQCQSGSLTGAVHLSNDNAGVLRQTQRGRKPLVERKGKCLLDLDLQYG